GRLRAGPESAGLRQAAHHRQLPADRAYRGPPAGTAQRAALAGGDAELARTAPGAASVHSANGGRKSADRPTATANKKPATKRRGLFVGWSTQTRWPPSVSSSTRNRRPGKRRLPYRKQTKKPATERRGLFVGWSTQMRWPPSVASAIRNRRPEKRRLPYRKQTKKPATKGRGLFVGWSTRMRWPPSSASEHPVIGGRENADRPADYSGLPRLPCWLTNCWTAFRSLGSTVRRSSRSNRSARCAGRLGAWPTPALMTASGNLTGWAVPRVTMGVARLRRHSRAARTPMAVCGSSSSPHSL